MIYRESRAVLGEVDDLLSEMQTAITVSGQSGQSASVIAGELMELRANCVIRIEGVLNNAPKTIIIPNVARRST